MDSPTPRIALSIAGSDHSGGAGAQADLKTFAALGVYGAAALTALTAQNTREVRAIHVPPLEFLVQQLDCVFEDLDVAATKLTAFAIAAFVAGIAGALRRQFNPGALAWINRASGIAIAAFGVAAIASFLAG